MTKVALVAALVLAALAALLLLGRVAQDPAYHGFADRRALLGLPNALDVLSNLPFALVGWLGLRVTRRPALFDDPWERWPYVALFGGALLTACGSSWYHLAPSNARLVWDRLPMTLAFMGLLTALIAERVSLSLARRVFVPALLFGIGSVVYWRLTELRGAGDLRPYGVVQFGSLLVVVLLVVLRRPRGSVRGAAPGRSADTLWLVGALAGYAAAKVLENLDHPIFALGQVVSGHSLKHLAAAAGIGCLVARLQARLAVRTQSPDVGPRTSRSA